MANRTDPRAKQIHGTNPQFLIDTVMRKNIHNDPYYKEKCFALTAETLVDRAIELKYVGGTYGGNSRPTKFMCLILKMLQIQPDTDIVLEFIKNTDYKYIRLLGAFYWRLTAKGQDVFKVLEPIYSDYRRVAFRKKDGQFEAMHIDEFIDHLIRDEIFCDVSFPRINKRHVYEEDNQLDPRESALNIAEQDEEQDVDEQKSEEDKKYIESEDEKQQQEKEQKSRSGRADIDDWNKGKATDQVIERRDGRDPKQRITSKYRSSSSSSQSPSYSRSYSSSSRDRERKDKRRSRSHSSSDSRSRSKDRKRDHKRDHKSYKEDYKRDEKRIGKNREDSKDRHRRR